LLVSNGFAQEDIQSKLDAISHSIDTAQSYMLDGKITELRNTMLDDVDPEINQISNYIENDIYTLQDVGIYNLEELNLSQGDLMRGRDMFKRAKVDVDTEINDWIFDNKINEARDIVKAFREISILIPEIEVSKKNTQIIMNQNSIDHFSINVRDIETYSKLKSMNISEINKKTEIKYDEMIYTYTNVDESNTSVIIKSINKKIKFYEMIKDVELYEVFPDYFNLSEVIFKSAHAPDSGKNRVLIYKGTLLANRTLSVTFIIKSNESMDTISQTMIIIPHENKTQEILEENIIPKQKDEPVKFGDIEIIEKQNYVPYIILAILVVLFLLLVLGNLMTRNKLAKDLEKYRRKINVLKGNV
jgi:hypothetical protein